MMKKDYIIGVLGGMGTYATVNFFQEYAKIFTADKEWNRPRIIIDNRCTMPSRVKAFYGENKDKLIDEMTDSLQHLIECGCSRIVLACNTSHLFLPMIYKKIPELEERVLHIVDNCIENVRKDKVKEVYLLGSEGTIDSKIYQNALKENRIKCVVPKQEEYVLLRKCIEAVKQNKYNDEVKIDFIELLSRHDTYILGCTELPILFDKYKNEIEQNIKVYDPLQLALIKMKEEYKNG